MSATDKERPGLADTNRVPVEIGQKVAPGPLPAALRSEFTYSIVSVEAFSPPPRPKSSDKRDNQRMRTRLRAGQLSDPSDKVIVDCLIHDKSRTGARLLLAHDKTLPKTFLLFDDVSKARFRADLAWQKGRDVGVRLRAV